MISVIERLPMAEYLKLPAVSASIIREVVERCPRAGWHASWLNPHPPAPDDTAASDAGSVAHAILLEGSEECCCVIDPNDHATPSTGNIPDGWTNKSIRAARDVARSAGKIPILSPKMAEIRAMVASAREFIEALKDTEPAVWAMFQPGGGDSELTVLWEEGFGGSGIQCRIRADRINNERTLIGDVKTTKASAEPDGWGRTQMSRITPALYRRGCQAVFGPVPEYKFLVIEQSPPYLCSLVGVDPAGLELGDAKVETGLRTWARCVQENRWPGYPNRTAYPETPGWAIAQWEEIEIAAHGQ